MSDAKSASNSSQLQNHIMNLDEILGKLQRVALQHENVLTRLRGDVTEPVTKNPPEGANQIDLPFMLKMSKLTDCLYTLSDKLNLFVDELNEYI